MPVIDIYTPIEGPNRRIAQLESDIPVSRLYLANGYARTEVAQIKLDGTVSVTHPASEYYNQKVAQVRGDSAYASLDGGKTFEFKIAQINHSQMVFGRTGHYDGSITFTMVFAYPKRDGPRPTDDDMLGAAAAIHMLGVVAPDEFRKYLSPAP